MTGFEKLRVYQLAEELADNAWESVTKWNYFAKDSVGKQLVNAADSVGANIAEGTGRGSYADNRRFARIARGSLFEVKHWIKRANARKLFSEKEFALLGRMVEELIPRLSAYIKSIGSKRTNNGPLSTGH